MKKKLWHIWTSLKPKMLGFFVATGFCFLLLGLTSHTLGDDLLDQTFQESKSESTVVDLGSTKEDVGNAVINGSGQDSLAVGIVKWLLRIMAVLAVSMGIYAGIMYISAWGDDAKQKKARDDLVKVAVGIALALSSLAIIDLVESITRSSIPLS